MSQTPLGESDLLLIIEMCEEGIEKYRLREEEHMCANNRQAAQWDRRIHERYVYLKSELLTELEHRRRAINAKASDGVQPGTHTKPDNDAPGS